MRMRTGQSSSLRPVDRTRCVRNLVCIGVLAFVSSSIGASQQPVQSASAPKAAVQTPENTVGLPDNAKQVNPLSEQEKQLADDTAKLLTLVNELKAEMDKSNKDMLSLSVIKKAEQVEKLAHKVSAEMKATLVN
jgi:hypothetical protein